MPYWILGGLDDARAAWRAGRLSLRGVTVVGGPFATRVAASAHLHGYLSAANRHAEAMLGVALPLPQYEIAEGRDLVGALFTALGLADPGER